MTDRDPGYIFHQHMSQTAKPSLEVIRSFGPSYNQWAKRIMRHKIQAHPDNITPIIVDSTSASGKRLVITQIAADLATHPWMQAHYQRTGQQQHFYHLHFGKVLRIAMAQPGWINHTLGSIPDDEYQSASSLMLHLGSIAMSVLEPGFLFVEANNRTARVSRSGQIEGTNRDLSLAHYLVSRTSRTFYADLHTDWSATLKALKQRADIALLPPEEIASRLSADSVIENTSTQDLTEAYLYTAGLETVLQQHQSSKLITFQGIKNGEFRGLEWPGTWDEFLQNYQDPQTWIEFFRDHISEHFIAALYHTRGRSADSVSLTNHFLNRRLHVHGQILTDAIKATELAVQQPQFRAQRETLNRFGLAK